TSGGIIETPTIVLIAGPWTNDIAGTVGLRVPYEVSRHKVITLRIQQDYDLDWPTVKDLTTATKVYFRPETGGVVLVGSGDHGHPRAAAARDDRRLSPQPRRRGRAAHGRPRHRRDFVKHRPPMTTREARHNLRVARDTSQRPRISLPPGLEGGRYKPPSDEDV